MGAESSGVFVVVVTWLGARFAVSGQINVGELVAFYGYAAFLVIPLRTAAEAVDKVTRSLVGARRMLNVLEIERHVDDPVSPAAEPPAGVALTDTRSGLEVAPGELVCLVSADPTETAALVCKRPTGRTLSTTIANRPPLMSNSPLRP